MRYNKILFFSLLLLAFSSCKKLIEIRETDFIDDTKALQTVTNCEQAVIGAYAGLGVEMSYLLNSTFSDEVKKSDEFYNAATTHEWQYGPDDVGIRDNFTAIGAYGVIIDRVNRVLKALPDADSTLAGDETKRSRLRGEALFLRAFCHFELYRYYCGNYTADGLAMPYMEEPTIIGQARIQMEPYFTKLEGDLTTAKGLLPNNLTDIFRATRLAATGLQARVALYKQEWNNAITYSTEYINAIPLATIAEFPGIWTDANKAESAFKLRRTVAVGGRIGSLYRGTSASASQIGTVTWIPSSKLWNSYDQTNDVRFNAYLKDEPLLTTAGRQSRVVQKYAGLGYAQTNAAAGTGENVADAKVFRTAEMYLIRAEARAETGSFTGANSAESDINTLRSNRIQGYSNVTLASKDAAISAIMTERFKELPFEGHRFWDLRRRNLPVERLAADAPTAQGTTLAAGNFRFLLPIPQREMLANKAMVQNTGYVQ